jgi:hypothetical protein
MSTPKRPIKPVKEVQDIDPAVQAILDQVAALEGQTDVSPLFGTATTPAFGKPTLFAGGTRPSFGGPPRFSSQPRADISFGPTTPVTTPVTGPVTGAFGPAGTTESRAWGSKAFGRSVRHGGRKLLLRRVLVPPPSLRAPKMRWWLPFCAFLDCFQDADYYLDTLWRPGQGWNFTQARESMGYQCAEETAYYGNSEDRHDPDGDGMCPDHWLHALETDDLEATLTDCEFVGDFAYDLWDAALPLMRELREQALANVEHLTKDFTLAQSYFYRVAGIEARDEPEDLARGIVDAVKGGPHDRGLAAAWADFVVRDWAEHLGPGGLHLEALYADMGQWCHMPQQPEHNIVFEQLREPANFDRLPSGALLPRLAGEYVIRRIEYHSALTRPGIVTSGFMGWRSLWVVPHEPDCDDDSPTS